MTDRDLIAQRIRATRTMDELVDLIADLIVKENRLHGEAPWNGPNKHSHGQFEHEHDGIPRHVHVYET